MALLKSHSGQVGLGFLRRLRLVCAPRTLNPHPMNKCGCSAPACVDNWLTALVPTSMKSCPKRTSLILSPLDYANTAATLCHTTARAFGTSIHLRSMTRRGHHKPRTTAPNHLLCNKQPCLRLAIRAFFGTRSELV